MSMASTVGTQRALATIETIADLAPIPDADQIVRARIRGWDVVVKKDEFVVGDLCVYFEVDSMLEVADPRFQFLAPRGVRTDVEGVYGHVLKTAKLRGQVSQGLALPTSAFPELAGLPAGTDVTGLLPLVKWEPPVPADFAGLARGFLPSWISTTDEERVQNVAQYLQVRHVPWLATSKIDGRSTTFYLDPSNPMDPVRGACSRTLDFLESPSNRLWAKGHELGIWDLMEDAYPNQRVAVQGELYGEGIQGNPLKVRGQHFAVFNVRVDGVDVPRTRWPAFAKELSVPTHPELAFPATVQDALAQVDKLRSPLADRPAEGVVWRVADANTVRLPDGRIVRGSFKVVSNSYLLKHDR